MSMAKVAKHAGVSAATVCRVLRHSALVKPETVQQVHDAIRAVGYVPQPPRTITRRRGGENSPAKVRDRRIAIITVGQSHRHWLSVPTIANFVAGVTAAGREMDVDVLLDEMPEPLELSRLVRRREIGGAIILVDSPLAHTPQGAQTLEMLSRELPVVWGMGGQVGLPVIDHVAPDNLTIGYVAAHYLASAGCKRVAFVTPSPDWTFLRFRAAAFASAIHDAGIELISYIIHDDPRAGEPFPGRTVVVPTLEDAAAAIAKGHRTDGLFVPTDEQMARLYPRLIQAGLQPGVDLKVIACDNERSTLSMMSPRPATIDLNTPEIARRALRRLRLRMDHVQEAPVLIHVPPTLVLPPDELAAPE